MIPYAKQSISIKDIRSVVKVLKSSYLTQGPVVPDFEKAVTEYCDAKFGVAVNSATSALHIACLALDLGPGDVIWTSPNSFVASANCGLYCGASIDFVDIDPTTYNMSPERLEEKLISAEKIGKLPKIVIPVHFAGQSCDMQKIYLLSKKYGFKIIEDASHAIGGKYKNKPIGSCEYSDITVFSFHPVKIITTGEGGMAVTNSEDLAIKMRSLRSHGIYNDPELFHERDDNEIWNYQQLVLGFNYRMTDIQASLGLSQMSKINKFLKKRQKQAYLYSAALQNTDLIIPWQSPETISSFHLYPIRVKNINANFNQKKIYDELKKRDIAVNLHYIPIHRQPYYEGLGFRKNQFPESELFHREVISLPIFPGLNFKKQNYVINSLREILK